MSRGGWKGVQSALVAVFLSAAASPALAVHPRDMRFEPLRWDPPRPERLVLGNGLVVHLLEDREFPLVDVGIYIHAGSILDPPEKLGLANLTGALLRYGGSERASAACVDSSLESMAVDLEIFVRSDYVAIGMSVLRKDLDRAMEILADLLLCPSFDPDRTETYREKRKEEVRRRFDRPAQVASTAFRRVIYGEESPWARLDTEESLDRVTREDLVDFHRRFYRPDHTVLTMSGDLTVAEMTALLEATLGSWEPGCEPPPPTPEVVARFEPSVVMVERRISQSYLRVGHLGSRFHEPDEFAAETMNYLLGGGGFLSRLTREVRSQRGLAYSIGSRYNPAPDRGLFEVECVTDAGKTHETLAVIVDLIRKMTEEPPGEEELDRAKEARIQEFVFAFDSPVRIVRQSGWLEYRGYPEGFLETWVDKVRAVTAEEVLEAARGHLRPDGLTVLVVGDTSAFDAPLSDLGEVRTMEVGP